MTSRSIFWTIPIVLSVAIVAALYQISLQESNTLSMILEHELSQDPGERAVSGIQLTGEEEFVVAKEEEKTFHEEDTVAENSASLQEPVSPVSRDRTTTAIEPVVSSPIEEETKPEVVRAGSETETEYELPVQSAEIEEETIITPVSQGALIETEENPWHVLSSPSEKNESEGWHTILIQNEYKLNYTILPRDSRMWQIAQSDSELKIRLMNEGSDQENILTRKEREKYAVQILSVERQHFGKALQVLHYLVHDGYYAYMHRTKQKFENKYWFRIRVGFFKTTEAAQSIGEEIYFRYRDEIDLPKNYWAVLPTQRELNRQLIDFQAQRNKPWFVELPLYDSQEKAIEDLPELIEISVFSYLAYKIMDKKVRYRIRLGFFETREEAQNRTGRLRMVRESFAHAQPVKL